MNSNPTLVAPPSIFTISGECTIRRIGDIWGAAIPFIHPHANVVVDATDLEIADATLVQMLCMMRINVDRLAARDPSGRLAAEFRRHGVPPLDNE